METPASNEDLFDHVWNLIKDKGFLLASIPFCSYLLSHLFEISYAKHFGIPSSLIQPSLKNVLEVSGILIFYGGLTLIIFDLLLRGGPKASEKISFLIYYDLVLKLIPFWILLLWLFLIQGVEWRGWSAVGLFALLFLISGLRLVLSRNERIKLSIEISERAFSKKNNEIQGKSKNSNHFFVSLAALIRSAIWLGFACIVASELGDANARREKQFLVCRGTSELAALRIDGDMAICTEFDRATRETKSTFRFVKLSEANNVEWSFESIGPLKPPPVIIDPRLKK